MVLCCAVPSTTANKYHKPTFFANTLGHPDSGKQTEMALISAKTIITSISLFHITLGFFFLTNPGTVADQAVVYVLGEAMGLVCSFLYHPSIHP